MRHMAGVPIEIVEDVLPGVETVDSDLIVRNNFETPWLRIVATRCPAREVQYFFDDEA